MSTMMRSSPASEGHPQAASLSGRPNSRSGTCTSSHSSWHHNPSSSLAWEAVSPCSLRRTRSQVSRRPSPRQQPPLWQLTTPLRSRTPSLQAPLSQAKSLSSSPQVRRVSWKTMTTMVPSTSWPLARRRKRRRHHRSLPPKKKLRGRKPRRRPMQSFPSRESLPRSS